MGVTAAADNGLRALAAAVGRAEIKGDDRLSIMHAGEDVAGVGLGGVGEEHLEGEVGRQVAHVEEEAVLLGEATQIAGTRGGKPKGDGKPGKLERDEDHPDLVRSELLEKAVHAG